MAETAIAKHPVQDYLKNPAIVNRTEELLKNRAGQFLTSLMAAVNNIQNLDHCVPQTVFAAAITAASLELPINNNLGFAYIIPYKNKAGNYEAQFQMGYKGFIQLAQRTGQYKQIAATAVYEGQLISEDPLDGNTYDWKAKKSSKIIGYVAKFRLVNGFEHELYMTAEDMLAHGKRYSQSFKKGFGNWQDDFESMALKTVLKLNISKFGPLSVELQMAIERDQAIIKDENKGELEYVDASKDDVPEVKVEKTKLFTKQAEEDLANETEEQKPVIKKKADKAKPAPVVDAEVVEEKPTSLAVDPKEIDTLLAKFEKIGLYTETLERYKRKSRAKWNSIDLADLKDLGNNLKKSGTDGVKKWLDNFEKTEAEAEQLFGKTGQVNKEEGDGLTFGDD